MPAVIAILARRVVYGREDDAVLRWPAFKFAPIARMSLYPKTSPERSGWGSAWNPSSTEREAQLLISVNGGVAYV